MSLLQALGLPRRRRRRGESFLDVREHAVPVASPWAGARTPGLSVDVPRERALTPVTPTRRSTVCEPPQWFVELVALKKGVQLERGTSQRAWVCMLCGLASDPGTQVRAECLGRQHDGIHHGGARTAQVMPAAEAVRLMGGEGR